MLKHQKLTEGHSPAKRFFFRVYYVCVYAYIKLKKVIYYHLLLLPPTRHQKKTHMKKEVDPVSEEENPKYLVHIRL